MMRSMMFLSPTIGETSWRISRGIGRKKVLTLLPLLLLLPFARVGLMSGKELLFLRQDREEIVHLKKVPVSGEISIS